MKISEVARLTGLTVRALQYYDEIGLLKPSRDSGSGYRDYKKAELETIQQILFFRELDFPLNEIRKVMENPRYNKREALQKQRDLLIQKRDRLNGLIRLIENTGKGESKMSFQEFDTTEIEKTKREYEEEVKARWGNTGAYRENREKTAGYTPRQWSKIQGEGEEILKDFAKCRTLPPDSTKVKALVKKWQDYITANFYRCDTRILSGLGKMYGKDERFRKNIDQNGAGTAEFLSEAIAAYCKGENG